MRTIKFRAWDEDNKRMALVGAMDWDPNGVIVSAHLDFGLGKVGSVVKIYPQDEVGDKIRFMQYTDLHDKNGKEIYEGDIVCADRYSAPNFEVVFNEVAFRVKDVLGRVMSQVKGGTEVIGNIYENPELLK